MVKHIVLYTLKDGMDKDAAVAKIALLLEPLVGKIPGLLHLEVRRCFEGMDYALYSEHESREALDGYAGNPLHLAALQQIKPLLQNRVVADYEIG